MLDALSPESLARLSEMATKAGLVLAIFILGWIASKWGHRLVLGALRRGKAEETLARFFASMAQYAILAFAAIASLDKAGVETTSLAAAVAAAGLAVGLALQGSLGNLASGVLLLFFRPFSIGDKISAAGHKGDVEDIGLFATTLSTPASERIIIPNASVTGGSIINHTVAGKMRSTITVGVAYGADIDHVCKILAEAALSAKYVIAEPAPIAGFVDMAASSLSFVVFCWSESGAAVPMQHYVRRAIYNRLHEEGIEIPFDQLVVHRAESSSKREVDNPGVEPTG